MPATSSATMKATISAKAPPSRLASDSPERPWAWVCAMRRLSPQAQSCQGDGAPEIAQKKRATRGREGSRALTREESRK